MPESSTSPAVRPSTSAPTSTMASTTSLRPARPPRRAPPTGARRRSRSTTTLRPSTDVSTVPAARTPGLEQRAHHRGRGGDPGRPAGDRSGEERPVGIVEVDGGVVAGQLHVGPVERGDRAQVAPVARRGGGRRPSPRPRGRAPASRRSRLPNRPRPPAPPAGATRSGPSKANTSVQMRSPAGSSGLYSNPVTRPSSTLTHAKRLGSSSAGGSVVTTVNAARSARAWRARRAGRGGTGGPHSSSRRRRARTRR